MIGLKDRVLASFLSGAYRGRMTGLVSIPIAPRRSKLVAEYQFPSKLVLRSFFLAGFRYKGPQATGSGSKTVFWPQGAPVKEVTAEKKAAAAGLCRSESGIVRPGSITWGRG